MCKTLGLIPSHTEIKKAEDSQNESYDLGKCDRFFKYSFIRSLIFQAIDLIETGLLGPKN